MGSASEEPFPSCPQNVRTGQTPHDCGRLLWTALYKNYLCLVASNKRKIYYEEGKETTGNVQTRTQVGRIRSKCSANLIFL